MSFIPIVDQSIGGGQFVSIQNNYRMGQQFLNTKSEINELINSLAKKSINHNQPDMAPANVHLSTIIYKQRIANTFEKKLRKNLSNVVNDIISGIESKKKIVVVDERKSLIEYIFNFKKF